MVGNVQRLGSVSPVSINAPEFDAIIAHVLRYELYRHRDISDRLAEQLRVKDKPEAFNRSTWDILYFLMQSYLQNKTPSVTDIYLSTNVSKGTAITGLAELERRDAVKKVRDDTDGRRRLIMISDSVAETLKGFLVECGQRFNQPAEQGVHTVGLPYFHDRQAAPLIDLLTELSHELRTPLTAILGFSEMIAKETLGPVHPAGYAEYARDIRNAASNLLYSMNERLDTTLAEHGIPVELAPMAPVDFDGLVDTACRHWNPVAERRGVTLRRKWGTVKDPIIADRTRLEQVINKLVEAAVIATSGGQVVDIETKIADGIILLRIQSPQAPFEPMFPASRSKILNADQESITRVLPLIVSIVEAHRGCLSLDKEQARRHITSLEFPVDCRENSAKTNL